ncbi:UDP-glucuronosyl and UDP-glucosyl transferase [Handroanthus impetiginosus]|uniref:Glycosyltransferase n=1 Tax=Handroanthus impetiginosus TaxID=429701 RepID=A0A2G9GYU7_9LAMI|nr:UDP-glucuronosyl and UDP-glucosyl transferase [Handroanthus impetiginosus]
MADAIVLYSSADHLNSLSILATFINKYHPSTSVILLSTAAFSPPPAVTYCRLPTPTVPQNSTSDPAELSFLIPRLNNQNLLKTLQEISQKSKIRAFIIDFFCNCSFEVSSSLNIPTFFCITTSAAGACTFLYWPTIHETIPENIGEFNDFIKIPGCPPIFSLDFPEKLFFRKRNIYKQLLDVSINMRKSAGIIVNTFYALEFRAMEALANGLCVPDAPNPPFYSLGPFIAGGTAAAASEHECLRWLDLQKSKSVIFLCFGRRGVFSIEQIKEIALGLENSGHRFLWVVRCSTAAAAAEEPQLEFVLPEGFSERTKERGLVLKSWAPQMEVLSHGAVGGFVTHCGQSSILEAVSFGVPMVAWPLYAEQKINRSAMVEDMKVALPLEIAADGFVTAAELEKRVRELMESNKGREIRRRLTEMKYSMTAAVGKGGSSLVALEKFMETVTRS